MCQASCQVLADAKKKKKKMRQTLWRKPVLQGRTRQSNGSNISGLDSDVQPNNLLPA